jgi:hypothetical protein
MKYINDVEDFYYVKQQNIPTKFVFDFRYYREN